MTRPHVAHQLDAISLIEADVGHNHVRMAIRDGEACRAGRIRFTAYHEVLFRIDHPPQTLANDGMVIDDEHAAGCALAI
jgi:hypothetical protein